MGGVNKKVVCAPGHRGPITCNVNYSGGLSRAFACEQSDRELESPVNETRFRSTEVAPPHGGAMYSTIDCHYVENKSLYFKYQIPGV